MSTNTGKRGPLKRGPRQYNAFGRGETAKDEHNKPVVGVTGDEAWRSSTGGRGRGRGIGGGEGEETV